MPVLRQETKAARKAARATVGGLEGGQSETRMKRNKKAAALFLAWCGRAGLPLCDDTARLATAMTAFVLDCWHEGEGKDVCCSATFGCAALLSLESKTVFTVSWRLLKKWSKLELPRQAPPALRLETLALAGLAWRENKRGLAIGLLLAYDLFLRTGEWANIDFAQVEGSAAVGLTISLGETKGVKRRGGVEMVTCRDETLINLYLQHCGNQRSGRLLEISEDAMRRWFKTACTKLLIGHRRLTPYSLRRGGLSAAAADGVAVSTLALRARWQDTKTAKVYIQEGQLALAELRLEAAAENRLRQAAANFGT